ncbi:hypothetical protein M419DRAFT_13255 [Trichoderma reesei RUT C-30]|uniref:Uncharacterized protein n=1 Tax=Hypocrea jecorina (strain ATCC 56765 / BCRC 32924 / NRRL 11460 / Rut C-30) TaxID=1344414 RepID=A0A024RVC0_HYPJR|nr:hypothetical protein M419DRAFT_13255 [Trichoderma reesei RUT C-30]
MNYTRRDIFRFNNDKAFITTTMKKAAATPSFSGESLSLLYEEFEFLAVPVDDQRVVEPANEVVSLRLRIKEKILEMRYSWGRFRLRLRKGPRYLDNLHVNF